MNRLGSAIGAFFYFYNPTIHARYLQGHVGVLLGHALAPLLGRAIWSLLHATDPNVKRHILAIGMIAFTGASLQPHWVPLQFLLVVPFVLVLSVLATGRLPRSSSLVGVAAGMALAMALNLPLVTIVLAKGTAISRQLHSVVHLAALSSNTRVLDALRLTGEPAGGLLPPFGYTRVDLRGLAGFIPILLALSAPWVASRRTRSIGLASVGAFLLALSLGTGTTYHTRVYLWLYEHIPFFDAFRESSKFLVPGTLFAATALSAAIDALSGRQRTLAVACALIVAGAQVWFVWPAFGGYAGVPEALLSRPTDSEAA
ncbi:MAG TPA: hypothetical protein VNL98_08495, partial [Gemmatimonadales bacterium]|nr:hypothetical protein [Gemmatimonadales bacterium]